MDNAAKEPVLRADRLDKMAHETVNTARGTHRAKSHETTTCTPYLVVSSLKRYSSRTGTNGDGCRSRSSHVRHARDQYQRQTLHVCTRHAHVHRMKTA